MTFKQNDNSKESVVAKLHRGLLMCSVVSCSCYCFICAWCYFSRVSFAWARTLVMLIGQYYHYFYLGNPVPGRIRNNDYFSGVSCGNSCILNWQANTPGDLSKEFYKSVFPCYWNGCAVKESAANTQSENECYSSTVFAYYWTRRLSLTLSHKVNCPLLLVAGASVFYSLQAFHLHQDHLIQKNNTQFATTARGWFN